MIDKDCNRQVLGCLIKRPQYLSEIDKYNLSIMDFSTRFERYIFSAITGLYNDGARNIAAIDIENYLSTNVVASETFKLMNGIEYVNDAITLAEVENFPYYYKKLKKLNLLTDLNKSAFFKSSNFYEEDLLAPNAIEINKKFEALEISDIVAEYRKALVSLETKYNVNKEVVTVKVADGIREFYENIGAEPNVGLALPGKIYSEIMKGARPGKLVIRSGESGLGKTINALIDACTLAYPYRYDNELKEWVLSGHSEKVLFIATEQEPREIYPKILAYLTGIETDRFDYGYFSSFEEHLIQTAIQIIEKYSDNLMIVRIPNPSIELVKLMVRETCLINDIHYVFYDYIFVSSNLIAEFRGSNLRNDK